MINQSTTLFYFLIPVFIFGNMASTLYALPITMGLGMAISIKVAYDYWKAKRIIQDLPTSTIRGMAIGQTEIKGKAVPYRRLLTSHTGKNCIAHKYTLVSASGKNIRGRQQSTPFLVDDGTGSVLVSSKGLELELKHVDSVPAPKKLREKFMLKGKWTLHEHVLMNGDPIYVLGTAKNTQEFRKRGFENIIIGQGLFNRIFMATNANEKQLAAYFHQQAKNFSIIAAALTACFLPYVYFMTLI